MPLTEVRLTLGVSWRGEGHVASQTIQGMSIRVGNDGRKHPTVLAFPVVSASYGDKTMRKQSKKCAVSQACLSVDPNHGKGPVIWPKKCATLVGDWRVR